MLEFPHIFMEQFAKSQTESLPSALYNDIPTFWLLFIFLHLTILLENETYDSNLFWHNIKKQALLENSNQ